MAKEQAVQFLEKFYTDRELQVKIIDGYRQAMCDIARRAGFLFTVGELRQVLREEEGRLTDDMLDQVAGGQAGTTVLSNANQTSQLIFTLLK